MINIRMGDAPLLKPLIDIPAHGRIGLDMLHQALSGLSMRIRNCKHPSGQG